MPVTVWSRIVRSNRAAEWCASAAVGNAAVNSSANSGFVMGVSECALVRALFVRELFEMRLPGGLRALVGQEPYTGLILPLLLGLDRLRKKRGIGQRHVRDQYFAAVVVRDQTVLLDDLGRVPVRIARLIDGYLQVRGLDDQLV